MTVIGPFLLCVRFCALAALQVAPDERNFFPEWRDNP